jgi:predicted transport protein/RecB family endonuclease NucS
MKLYQMKGEKLTPIRSESFRLEKEIQKLVENNVEEIFGLEFVKSEMNIGKFRFDTLCFDRENSSFIIIEYKKGSDYSVVDQGYTYLSQLLNNKSDFILEYNEIKGINLKRSDVDWSQSRIIFISNKFTDFQKQSINFKDIPFELWEIERYTNGILVINQVRTGSGESIEPIPDTETTKSVKKEVTVYTEEYHYKKNTRRKPEVIELYKTIRDRILGFGDDMEIKPRKHYIGFKRERPFTDVEFYTDHLKFYINLKKGKLLDPQNVTKDVSEKGHWGNGDYETRIHPDGDVEYLLYLIKQSYDKQGK